MTRHFLTFADSNFFLNVWDTFARKDHIKICQEKRISENWQCNTSAMLISRGYNKNVIENAIERAEKRQTSSFEESGKGKEK